MKPTQLRPLVGRDFSGVDRSGYAFGVTTESFRAGLMKMLDMLDKGHLSINTVTTTEVADSGEFVTKDLIIRFYEKELKL